MRFIHICVQIGRKMALFFYEKHSANTTRTLLIVFKHLCIQPSYHVMILVLTRKRAEIQNENFWVTYVAVS